MHQFTPARARLCTVPNAGGRNKIKMSQNNTPPPRGGQGLGGGLGGPLVCPWCLLVGGGGSWGGWDAPVSWGVFARRKTGGDQGEQGGCAAANKRGSWARRTSTQGPAGTQLTTGRPARPPPRLPARCRHQNRPRALAPATETPHHPRRQNPTNPPWGSPSCTKPRVSSHTRARQPYQALAPTPALGSPGARGGPVLSVSHQGFPQPARHCTPPERLRSRRRPRR
jgi:hypothetical protein